MSNKKLQPGDAAPDFELNDADGQPVRLSEVLKSGKKVVLYFYPKDGTPHCTLQATDFSRLHLHFEEAGAEVLGVNMDSCGSHARFREKKDLKIRMLSDPDGKVLGAYGVLRGGLLGIGKTPAAVIRSTFLIDEKGIIRRAEYGVKADGHADDLLNELRG